MLTEMLKDRFANKKISSDLNLEQISKLLLALKTPNTDPYVKILSITCLAIAYRSLPDIPRTLRYLELNESYLNTLQGQFLSLQLHLQLLKGECYL